MLRMSQHLIDQAGHDHRDAFLYAACHDDDFHKFSSLFILSYHFVWAGKHDCR